MRPPQLQQIGELELMQLILHNLGEGVVVADTDGRFVVWNPEAERIIGKGMQDVPPEQWSEEYGVFKPDKTPCPSEELPLYRAIHGETVIDEELFVRNPSNPEGAYIRVSARPIRDLIGRRRGGVAIFRDSTRERKGVEDLRRLAAVTNASQDAVLGLSLEGRVGELNPAALALWRTGEAGLRGKALTALASPADREALAEAILRAAAGEAGVQLDVEFDRPQAMSFTGSVSLASIRGADGRAVGLAAVVRDVTAAKRIQQMKDGLLAVASHELRAPAASIQMSLELIASLLDRGRAAEAREMLALAVKNCDRLIRTLSQALDAERLRTGVVPFNPEPVELASFIREAVELNQPFATRFGVTLKAAGGAEPCWGFADRDRLLQAISNLLGNAAKFSPKGSEVSARVSGGAKPRLWVEDHGPGIPPDLQGRLFTRFSRGRTMETAKKEGAGLGLYITKQLVEGMGGEVGFETEVGKGTRFFIELRPAQPPHSPGSGSS